MGGKACLSLSLCNFIKLSVLLANVTIQHNPRSHWRIYLYIRWQEHAPCPSSIYISPLSLTIPPPLSCVTLTKPCLQSHLFSV